MRILMLGEFSGFYSTLKKGFVELGHSAYLVSAPDSFKEIPGIDYVISSKFSTPWLRKPVILLKMLSVIFSSRNYDFVMIINQGFLRPRSLSVPFMIWLRLFNKRIVLSACGEDVPFIKYGRSGKYKWWIYDEAEGCPGVNSAPYQTIGERIINFFLVRIVDGVIPTSYGYSLPWNEFYPNKTLPVVGLPVEIKKGQPQVESSNKKIVFLHGINRPCHKGSRYIIPALERLKEEFPCAVDIIIKGGLPLEEYLELVEQADVVVDQCLGYDHQAMNTLLSLSAGKIVAIAAVDESFQKIGITDHPIVVLRPDINYIYNQLKEIVARPEAIPARKLHSRKWVCKHNNHIKIATEYLQVMDSLWAFGK